MSGQGNVREVGDVSVDAGRGQGQMGWYEYAARRLAPGKSVLDVGCGLGAGLDVLATRATWVGGQDLDSRLARTNVVIGSVDTLSSKSVDLITCVDVIEHVEADREFVQELGRIARETVFVTTPNFSVSRCHWPFHVREYTPRQLRELLSTIGQVTMFKGEPSGHDVWPINDKAYDLLNDGRNWPPTALLTRAVSKALPAAWRLRAHLAAVVDVSRR